MSLHLLNPDIGRRPVQCRDKFLVGICNIVARASFSQRRAYFRRWRFLVSQHQTILQAIRAGPGRRRRAALWAWRRVAEFKIDRRRWRQEVQQDALSLFVRSEPI
jgi:DNA-binding GntR family transcriptional regulator